MFGEKQIVTRVVENYVRTGEAADAEVTVVLLPDNKTSYVEKTEDGPLGGRGISLDEYRVDERVVWGAYSSRTRTVYLSESRRL
jgi:hypothetical protein